MLNWLIIDDIIKGSLKEDMPIEDITTNCIIDENYNSTIDLIAKDNGIIAGLEVFKRVFDILSINLGDAKVELLKKDGDTVAYGDLVATLTGSTKCILAGERTALNILQRMSGIATLTNLFVKEIKDTNTKILDTRKTTPLLRILEKYSVIVGGGFNHRFNLSDGILLKDNHIAYAGGIKNAVSKAKASTSFVRKIEVETENLDMVKEALQAKADIIMLDNMDLSTIKAAITMIDKKALTECSGNVNLTNIKEIANTGVDFISIGALTHSFKALDLSMKNLRRI
ncbi:nicotinate-nucleotide pyrophosphorylase [carboxylating] [Clostridium cavendishii DSM 21758]|uniref:Probable nicotinate-nucleotide pyrophosphorylase [carboxylating] n=1 Tax=Clostridium cavendishii DSM 21758 TaxID=1121302 RepID=A0A1M6ARJ3_9CLOT|nr:carboxylating nicotinate-nucleotide diphosphorylase [Clostridium cavendishii]SHI39047.1 nicotinate-nucleotide pyrophosphorylase [carboxylating] [Clostridium cavendishii DSM 21758]